MSFAGRVMFWGGIASGTLGILGGIGAIVVLSGKAPSTKATAGLIGTSSSSEAAVAVPPPAAKAAHPTSDEERTDHEKAGEGPSPAAPLASVNVGVEPRGN